jgi:hypothetical protein
MVDIVLHRVVVGFMDVDIALSAVVLDSRSLILHSCCSVGFMVVDIALVLLQLLEAFDDDSASRKLQLSKKFEQTAALLENSSLC